MAEPKGSWKLTAAQQQRARALNEARYALRTIPSNAADLHSLAEYILTGDDAWHPDRRKEAADE